MTVKILSSTSTFNGVSYNTNKTQSARGELMTFRNFGYLQTSNKVTPEEMKTFLKVHSNRNTRVQHQQFHAMISCKDREYSKVQLTELAEKWLQKMGYGDNTYLIVFHGDTKNNHVHIVSSRICSDGKKINDSMERIRAQKSMQEILDMNPNKECQQLAKDIIGAADSNDDFEDVAQDVVADTINHLIATGERRRIRRGSGMSGIPTYHSSWCGFR